MTTKNGLKCINPVKIPGIPDPIGRCGRCLPCSTHKKLEWGNRMALENYGLNYRPLFVTLSYDQQHLPSNFSDCIKYCQLWIKRLRRRGLSVRYFLATEEGTKNGRLHQHAIMWIPELAGKHDLDKWKILYDAWGAGRITVEEVRHTGGIYYTAKYITKNLSSINSDGYIYSRYEGKWIKPGRLYTWSNNPRFGAAGINRWYELAKAMNANTAVLPPNWFNMHLLGKQQKVYIPLKVYTKFVQEDLGISLNPKVDTIRITKLDIDISEIDTIIKLWPVENAKNILPDRIQ